MCNTLALIRDAIAKAPATPEYVLLGDREFIEVRSELDQEPGGRLTYQGVQVISVDKEYFLRVVCKEQ